MRYPEVQDAVTHGRYESALDHYINEGSNLLHNPCDFYVSRYYLEQAKYLDGFSLRKLPRSKQSTVLWYYLKRPEARRGGKEWVSPWRIRGWTMNYKKNTDQTT